MVFGNGGVLKYVTSFVPGYFGNIGKGSYLMLQIIKIMKIWFGLLFYSICCIIPTSWIKYNLY